MKVVDGQITWPWTGRIREYLLELWPRHRARGNEETGHVDEDPDGPIFESLEQEAIMLSADWEPGLEILENRLRTGKMLSARDLEIEDEIERALEALEQEMQDEIDREAEAAMQEMVWE